jgi:hypothetical protein
MAQSVADITQNFTEFSKHYQEYLRLQGKIEYDPNKFAWFRPEKVTDTTDRDQISAPYETDELDEMARKLMESANVETVNSGDYALVMFQHDAILSACRSFATRHKNKLRHFAHADGISDRLGNEFGTFHYSYDMTLLNIKRQAAMDKG